MIVDMEIDVHLLGIPVGPIGWHVIGSELDADDPLAADLHPLGVALVK